MLLAFLPERPPSLLLTRFALQLGRELSRVLAQGQGREQQRGQGQELQQEQEQQQGRLCGTGYRRNDFSCYLNI